MSNSSGEQVNQNAEQVAVTRYTYRYHNDSIGALNILLLGILVLVGLTIFLSFVQITTVPSPVNFSLNDKLQITPQVPLSEEGISNAALLNWVNEFVNKAFSFNYSNIQKQPAKMQPYFSDAAMSIYTDLLVNDEDFRTLADKQYVVSIVPTDAPEILVGKAFNNRFAWQVRVRASIIFSNALVRGSHDVDLDFLIWRVSDISYPLGVSVATFTRTIKSRTGAQTVRR